MSGRVKRQVLCHQMLNRTNNTNLRKAILEYADADLISDMCECAHNKLRGTVRLTPREKVRLRKYKDKLRLIANRIPTSVVSSVGNHCLSTAAESTIRLNGTREEDGVCRSMTVGKVADPDTTTNRHIPTRPRFRNDKHTRQDRHRREREGAVLQ